MRKLSGKRFILGLMALILCVMVCAPAFASVGDRVLMHETTLDGYLDMTVQAVFSCGDGLIIVKYSDTDVHIERYADVKAEPELFVLADKDRRSNGDENGESWSTYVNPWFSWQGELYGIESKSISSARNSREEITVKHAKLENGKVIMEESGLPELDLSGVIEGENGSQYIVGIHSVFTTEDKLFIAVYDYDGCKLEIIDLHDGSCTESEITGDFEKLLPGPDGSLLIVRGEWGDNGESNTVKVNSLDLASQEEKEVVAFTGMDSLTVNPAYDRKTDTLYIIRDGELWAVPQFDVERMEAVNDCANTGDGMIMLSDGFVAIWEYDTVMIKNTDPAQRGSVTLRISDRGYGSVMNETVYDMNNKRGDISVVVRSDWGTKPDVVQAMLKQDSTTDIYVLQSDDNDFASLRNRGYLPDLSGNEKIAENTNRLYPYIQDAVRQDGKIIGVPVCFDGGSIGIHMEAWKAAGGTEEELPKTWGQFFDWLEKLPERLKGKDISVTDYWTTRPYFRGSILQIMLNQYEIMMEKKGEDEYYFTTPEMCELVRRLDNLDYETLQIRESDDEDGDGYMDEVDERTPLLLTDNSVLFYDTGAYVPMALSIPEEEPVIPIQVSIAFVNPYSAHIQEAMEFLALAGDHLHINDQYAAYTDMTEPVRYSSFESERGYVLERIDGLKKQIQKEEDGNDRETLQEMLQETEEELKEMEDESWWINREQIDRYQKWQGYFKARGYSFLNVLYGSENDEEGSNEYDKLFYDSFGKAPEEVLGMLDKKVRMIRLESN